MGKISTPLSSNLLLFICSFTACGRDSCWDRHLAVNIDLIEIRILCFIKNPLLFSFLVKNGARHLNIRDALQPPCYLWSCFHNEDKENIEPQNVEKANSVVGAGPTVLKPRSAYPHLSHVASARNISIF